MQHGLYNLSLVLVGLLFFHDQSIIDISTHEITVKVTELMYINKENSVLESKIDNDIIYSITAEDVSIYSVFESLEIGGPLPYDDTWVDIHLISTEGISKSDFLSILKEEVTFDRE